MYVLDTDIISNLLKRAPSPNLIRHLAETPPDQQYTTAITIGELIYGACRRPDADALIRRFSAKINTAQILPFDYASACTYGRIRAHLEQRGTTVPEADLRIGAIALTCKMTVITGNTRHFALIPDLSVENWL
ncbi:MAG: PIN domain-containing protein [Deltaproteobacteria bacterium]|nr:PIN domain-containing protein [Deltaproteobacteria bacterium]